MQNLKKIRYYVPLAAGCWLLATVVVWAAAKTEKPRVAAVSELAAPDLEKIKQLFQKLAETFLTDNVDLAQLCAAIFAGSPAARDRFINNLEKEFQQTAYLEFKVLGEIRPDDTLGKNQHTVDVSLAYTFVQRENLAPPLRQKLADLRSLDHAAPERQRLLVEIGQALVESRRKDLSPGLLAELPKALSKLSALDYASPERPQLLEDTLSLLGEAKLVVGNRICQTFTVKKCGDGSFRFLRSSFFDGLGQRNRLGSLVTWALLVAVLSLALLSFCIWMGWAAFRLRPRSFFWRVVVFVPLAGAAAFFLLTYLPVFLRRLIRKGGVSSSSGRSKRIYD